MKPSHRTRVADFGSHWPKRSVSSHKGTFGHLLVIAGSTGTIGAGYLACRAALRSGAGLVTYALPAHAYEKFDLTAAEVMVQPIPDHHAGRLTPAGIPALTHILSKMTAVAIGPGLGVHPETTQVLATLFAHLPQPLVIDADALNAIATTPSLLDRRKGPTILTPHPAEMGRLIHATTTDVQADRRAIAQAFATAHHVICVLKGHRTIIAPPRGVVYVNPTGNPGMATAGTGDVLTGVIGGLLAQKMPLLPAAIAGVYLHGLAGDMAAATKGATGMIASDLIEALPSAIQRIESSL